MKMTMTMGRKLAFAFGALLTLLVVFGIIILFNIHSINKKFSFVVEHDAPVMANARELSKLVVDMETGERGFCITQKEEFLEPYHSGVKKFNNLIRIQKKLVSDNPGQVKALERIEGLVKEWQDKAGKPLIAMAKKVAIATVDANNLQSVLRKGTGKNILDEMRKVYDAMGAEFRKTGNIKGVFLTEMVAKAMVDKETGERGFLITGKEEFLEPYTLGKKELEDGLKSLRAMVANAHDREATANDLNELEKLSKKWLTEAGEPEIELRRGSKISKNIDGALIKGSGKTILDNMRKIMDQMESRYLKAQNEKARALVIQTAKGMVDQETGLRGFLITGKEEFLEPYKSGQKLVKDSIGELRKLNSNAYDVFLMSRNIDKLEELSKAWEEKAAKPEILARREMNKHPESVTDLSAMLGLGVGKAILDQIREGFNNFIQVEESLTVKRFASAEETTANTENMSIIFVVVSMALGGALATIITRGITKPVNQLINITDQIASGNLTAEMTVLNRNDEIGVLSKSFSMMVSNLQNQRRKQIQEIGEAINLLNTSSNEILTTVSQLAAGSNETATAMSETTATVEEVKQTAKLCSEKANNVSEQAKRSADISRQGVQNAEEVVAGTKGITEQMESIGESIVSLSEQSQAIGEIINSVKDIAEQSNLLAVNASIEAMKAGDYGKGFTVVAQEIKNLAEQSKKSTAQVRSILNDIQKATSSAVMATEQGSKVVAAGMEQATGAGAAIAQLSESIETASQSAIQIAASSQQQLAGMEQLAVAMENIKLASEDSAKGTKQLEEAAARLNDLGKKLDEMVKRYQV